MVKRYHNGGFTLIELVIVIVILAIIAIIALPRIFTSGYKPKAEALRFITQVRFIQHQSMLHGGGYGLGIDATNNRYYFFLNVPTNLVRLPGESSDYVNVSNGISAINSKGAKVTQIFFDNLGRPDIDNNSLNNDEMNFSDENPYREVIIVTIDGIKIDITPYSGGVYEE